MRLAQTFAQISLTRLMSMLSKTKLRVLPCESSARERVTLSLAGRYRTELSAPNTGTQYRATGRVMIGANSSLTRSTVICCSSAG